MKNILLLITTGSGYGLERPGIESRWGRKFPHPSRPVFSPPSLLYNGYRVPFPTVKRPRRAVNHPPPSSDEVKERVALYLYSPSGPSWPVLGWALPLSFFYWSTPLLHTRFSSFIALLAGGKIFLKNHSTIFCRGGINYQLCLRR